MIDRETISRTIINILDEKHYYKYDLFSHEDMADQILSYAKSLTSSSDAIRYIERVLKENNQLISKITHNKDFSIKEYNHFNEELRDFRRNYLLK